MQNDPVKNYYLKGYADGGNPDRVRMSAVPQNFKLAYSSGWYDARLGRAKRYEEDDKC